MTQALVAFRGLAVAMSFSSFQEASEQLWAGAIGFYRAGSLSISTLLLSLLLICRPFVNLARLPPMLSSQLALAIPLGAAVYLLAVHLLLMFAQRDRLSRRVSGR